MENNIPFHVLLENEIIPRLKEIRDKEKEHLFWLIDRNAPLSFIKKAQEIHFYFNAKVEEYEQYLNKLKNEHSIN